MIYIIIAGIIFISSMGLIAKLYKNNRPREDFIYESYDEDGNVVI